MILRVPKYTLKTNTNKTKINTNIYKIETKEERKPCRSFRKRMTDKVIQLAVEMNASSTPPPKKKVNIMCPNSCKGNKKTKYYSVHTYSLFVKIQE